MTATPAVIFISDSLAANKAKAKLQNCHETMPLQKRFKAERLLTEEKSNESLKDLLINFNKEMTKKLESIETRVDCLADSFDNLEQKVESLSSAVSEQTENLRLTVTNQENLYLDEDVRPAIPISSKVTYIKLNREEDYPDGSWLGDPDNSQCRVRCHILPTEMFHIHASCTTAEKMALSLLDHLFDRETQSCSNISGTGKHKKQQLDPLYIYGLQCHIKFHFNITEQDWNRIKQNLDSKCRSAFRRKIKGLPLTPKATCINNVSNTSSDLDTKAEEMDFDSVSQSSITNGLSEHELQSEDLPFQEINSENEANILERAIKEAKGEFQVLHATPEEVAEIQQSHQIQLFYCEDNLSMPSKAPQSTDSSPLHAGYDDDNS